MSNRKDLQLLLTSGVPLVVVETHDEARFLKILVDMALNTNAASYRPLFRWTVTDGLQRVDLDLEPQAHNAEPAGVLKHIRALTAPGVFALLDFHPYLSDPVNVRLLKDIAIQARERSQVLLLISHELQLPPELERHTARFEVQLPDEDARERILARVIEEYRETNPGQAVKVDAKAQQLLIKNLAGLSHADTEQLARNAVYQDGAISQCDIPRVMEAKYQLLNEQGVLSYEYDTAQFADIGGFRSLKSWLGQRKNGFLENNENTLDPPKGVLLIGIQGCGKSLAAKATAGVFGVPLLRLDFGSLYNKYHGETEKNLRESLQMSEVMSPCVLWIDEIEKGIATGTDDSGTSQRVLATFLTWMAEQSNRVMVVATANDISSLPPELIRKGRFDEIFFVDLPDAKQRGEIFSIHLRKRGLDPAEFDLPLLVQACDGFSGAELEQAVVSGLYAARSLKQPLGTPHLLMEIRRTRPLSVVMAEKVAALRAWAGDRTVPAH